MASHSLSSSPSTPSIPLSAFQGLDFNGTLGALYIGIVTSSIVYLVLWTLNSFASLIYSFVGFRAVSSRDRVVCHDAVLISRRLLGITTMQTHIYYMRRPNDSALFKTIVSSLNLRVMPVIAH